MFAPKRTFFLSILFSLLALTGLVYPTAAALASTGYVSSPAGRAAPALQSNAFRPEPCSTFKFTIPTGVQEPTDLSCGYLTVPAEHANPSGATLELGVVIIKSHAAQVQPDPFVLAQGGPGGSTIDTYAEILLGPAGHDLVADRDIILFDQRGTLYSKPDLYCTEVDQLTADTINQELSIEESNRLYLQALTACHARLAQEDGNLSNYNSLENAADIETLRQALGYDKINLYGVSYGTLLALHYMRQFPNSLRSVILDGVVPPQENFILNVAQTENNDFTKLFEGCKADADCNRNYPDLETVFGRVVDRLNKTPAVVQMTDLKENKTYNDAVIDGHTFLSGVFQMMYSSGLIKMLPRMIYDADKGNFDVYARIYSIFVFDHSTSSGMYYSVLCAEDADFTPDQQNLNGVRPQVVEVEKDSPAEFLKACQMWQVKDLGSSVDQPVTSDVPTLLLSGGFDPITPANYAAEVAKGLSHAYNVVIPTGGHGQMLDGKCQNSIILAFLHDPQTQPDTSCVASLNKPEFYTPGRIVALPLLLSILNAKPAPAVASLALLLGLLFLWTAALVFPIAWLVNIGRRKPAPAPSAPAIDWSSNAPYAAQPYAAQPRPPAATPRPTLLTRLAGWLPVISAASLTVFLALFTISIVNMINQNDNVIFYGLPGSTRLYFILPLIFALLAIAMLVAMVQLWARHVGGGARRIYYTLLTLTALLMVGLLAYLGMLTAIL